MPSRWLPPLQDRIIASCRRYQDSNGFCVEVFRHIGISLRRVCAIWCVSFSLASAVDRYLTATRGQGRDRFRVPHPLDLSKAPKLKDVEFVAGYTGIQWITTTLQATIPKPLRQISIYSYGTRFVAGETGREWQDLDRILVKLWTSYSILPKIVCCDRLQMFAPNLLPELTSRGISPEFRSYWKK